MKSIEKTGEIYIVNDFSTKTPPKFNSLSNIKSINILNLKKNVGSQKAISIGLRHLEKFKKNMIITILDSDGEDDTDKIPRMIELAEKENDKVIVSTRTKRHENQEKNRSSSRISSSVALNTTALLDQSNKSFVDLTSLSLF